MKGIKVLDCTRLLPYEYCTMILGDLGAEVLKIEEPKEGDYGRWGDSARSYESQVFVMANRNKKSMKLNLKHETGKEILKKLASTYDVLLESFRPGVMDRLGLGYKEIQKVNPDIIYCSSSGYGQSGPYKSKAGHDINYLSISGILSCTGQQTERPVLPGILIGDMAGGGIFTALVIISAVLGREKNGKGQFIDVCQTDLLTSLNILNLADALAKKKGRKARPVDLRGANLCYNTFKTSDGKFVALGAVESKFWENFCRAVGREDWIPYHLLPYEEGSESTEELKALFAAKTQKEWVEVLKNLDVCFSPILTPDETLENRHLKERETFTPMDDPERGETVQVGFPARFSAPMNFKRSPAPFFGQHTNAILAGLGYTESQMEILKKNGVV